MSSQGFLLIDLSNVGYAAASSTKLSVGTQDTNAIYGTLRILRPYIARMPQLVPIGLWDGISWRKQTFPEYKASRGKKAETKHEIEQLRIRKSFQSQRGGIKAVLAALGIRQMTALNLEADDLAGLLTDRYAPTKKVIMISGDKDWVQLVGPGVAWLDPIKNRRVTPATIKDVFGVDTPRQFLELKALIGDPSDEIPGIGGVGEKGALEFMQTYGSVGAFLNGCIFDKTIDLAKLPKKFRDFAESDDKQHIFRRNMMLMDLRSPEIPKPQNLQIEKGEFSPTAFQELCNEFAFKSLLSDLSGWLEPFERIAA